MFKENGRDKTTKKEQAIKNSLGKAKRFKCTSCENSKFVNNVEFGEEVFCNCGKVMEEYIKS